MLGETINQKGTRSATLKLMKMTSREWSRKRCFTRKLRWSWKSVNCPSSAFPRGVRYVSFFIVLIIYMDSYSLLLPCISLATTLNASPVRALMRAWNDRCVGGRDRWRVCLGEHMGRWMGRCVSILHLLFISLLVCGVSQLYTHLPALITSIYK